ncbi:MAG: hypothetical protein Q9218_006766 [Villophora microphyllina]
MLPLSINEAFRRGAWTCLACSNIPRCPQALIASAAVKNPGSRHQRKHSSSKASSPPKDEARPLATASAAHANGSPKPMAEKRSSGRRNSRTTSKQSAVKARMEAYPNIPSVPSTQHLHPMNVHVASFFSRHRPISVTTSFPPTASEAAFSTIFEPKVPPKIQPSDVIYTVSSAIDSFENAVPQEESEGNSYSQPRQRTSRKHETIHLDSNPQHVGLNIEELAKTFRPFNVPPPPVPMADPSATKKPSKSSSPTKRQRRSATPKERTYTTVLTITEQAHSNGSRTYQASLSPMREENFFTPHAPTSSLNAPSSTPANTPTTLNHDTEVEIIEIDTPNVSPISTPKQPFLERMRKRQRAWEENLKGEKSGVWRAISVKRQRKLKMKKHKYKKLMRKTRNLRRRLDRN